MSIKVSTNNGKLLEKEVEIASVSGKVSMPPFSVKKAAKIVLTTQCIYEEITLAGGAQVNIIPLNKIDSFGISTTQNYIALILGLILLPAYGLGIIFLFVWWFSRTTALIIYSVSGKTTLALEASLSSKNTLYQFLNKIQETITNSN